jgi:hypothetical protein
MNCGTLKRGNFGSESDFSRELWRLIEKLDSTCRVSFSPRDKSSTKNGTGSAQLHDAVTRPGQMHCCKLGDITRGSEVVLPPYCCDCHRGVIQTIWYGRQHERRDDDQKTTSSRSR